MVGFLDFRFVYYASCTWQRTGGFPYVATPCNHDISRPTVEDPYFQTSPVSGPPDLLRCFAPLPLASHQVFGYKNHVITPQLQRTKCLCCEVKVDHQGQLPRFHRY